MLREKVRNTVMTIIAISKASIISVGIGANTNTFTNQSTRNNTKRLLLSLSVPYLPCIKIANFCIKFRITSIPFKSYFIIRSYVLQYTKVKIKALSFSYIIGAEIHIFYICNHRRMFGFYNDCFLVFCAHLCNNLGDIAGLGRIIELLHKFLGCINL